MAAIKGRVRRAENVPTVLLQARVAPEIRDEVHVAAAASGVSIAYYLETLLREHLSSEGALPVVQIARSRSEELAIPAA